MADDVMVADEEFIRVGQTTVVTEHGRYHFPAGYSFRVDSGSLVVEDGAGGTAMVLGPGHWGAAFAAGAELVHVGADEDEDEAEPQIF